MESCEDIPALSAWKIINDTIPHIKSETYVKKLTNLLRVPEFSDMFVNSPNSALSKAEHDRLSDKYKAFSVWFLGRIMYLLSQDEFKRHHDLLIGVQLQILQAIQSTQGHIYHELTQEYISILKQLNQYQINQYKGKINLQAFIPETHQDLQTELDLTPLFIEVSTETKCIYLQNRILKLIDSIIIDKLECYYLTPDVDVILENLILILRHAPVGVKLNVFDIYTKMAVIQLDFPPRIETYLKEIFNMFEKLLFVVFTQNIKVNMIKFKKILHNIVNVDCKASLQQMCEFVVQKDNCERVDIDGELFKACLKHVGDLFVVESVEPKYFPLYQTRIVKDILNSCDEKESVIIDDIISKSWGCIYKSAINKINDTTTCNENCVLNECLTYIKLLLATANCVKIDVLQQLHLKLYFFEEAEFLSSLLFGISHHLQNCNIDLDINTFIQILTYVPFLTEVVNAKMLFSFIAYIFITKDHLFEYPNYFIGYSDTYEIMNVIDFLYTYLSTKDIDKNQAFKYVCSFASFASVTTDVMKYGSEFGSIVKHIMNMDELSKTIIHYLPAILSGFEDSKHFLEAVYLPALKSDNTELFIASLAILDRVMLVATARHKKLIKCDNDVVSVDVTSIDSQDTGIKAGEYSKNIDSFNFIDTYTKTIIKIIFVHMNNDNEDVRLSVVNVLPAISKYLPLFAQVNCMKWMVLVTDDSVAVREKFAKVIHHVLEPIQNNKDIPIEHRNRIICTVFNQMKSAMKRSIQYEPSLQESIILTLESLSKIKLESIPLNVIKLLLYYIMMPFSKHPLTAIRVFSELPNHQKTTILNLYSKHKYEICETIVDICVINSNVANYTLALSLERINALFNFGPKYRFVEETRFLLPLFVVHAVTLPQSKKLILEFAEMNDMDLVDFLASNFGYIYLQVLLQSDNDLNKKIMEYMEVNTGINRGLLMKRNCMIILNELLLHFHDKPEKVIESLKYLAQEDSDGTSMTIQEFIQPKFLGVLQFFDLKLIPHKTNKQTVLLSLAELFKYMGPKHITPLRFKIIAMLQTALNLNYGSYPELNCVVWDAFVHSCDVEMLGPQLGTIFISILPLVKVNSEKINSIFKYLIIDNQKQLKDYIPDLFFVVDVDFYQYEIDFEIRNIIENSLKGKTFKDEIMSLIKYLNYETSEVRIYALKSIRNLIEQNRQGLDVMILGYNGLDSIIVDLLENLTIGSRVHDPVLRLAYGECIGELGAIEPAHLPRRYTQEQNVFNFYITDQTFIVNSLMELTRTLQAEKNTRNMDRLALAIQELLKTNDITPDKRSKNHELWKLFPESTQELMLPLLSSKFTATQYVESIVACPIFGSTFAFNFTEWIHSWTTNLISTIKSDKNHIFQACFPSMKQDHKTLMHFLPYTLLHALMEGGQKELQQIYDEFLAVIESQTNSTISDSITNVRPIRGEDFCLVDQSPSQHQKSDQYTKVVFVLLDFLDRWLREWLWEKGYAGGENGHYKKIKVFMSSFCKLKLAKSNFECGEYPRALMYIEDYMATNTEDNDNLSLLAEIYYRLDEPDGVAGVTALRQTEPTLQQRILGLEVSGKLADAAACYERLPKPMHLFHIQGFIRCYLDLDNVNTALNISYGTMESQPELTTWMFEAQAESLWRLGRYDELDNLLKKPELEGNATWGVNIGQVLLDLKKLNREGFKTKLKALKMAQVNCLAEASLEEGAYEHGYLHISRLHALTELEQVERIVNDLLLLHNDQAVCDEIMNKIKSDWSLRIKVVQETIRIVEPILCLRRVAIEQAKQIVQDKAPHAVKHFDALLGETWLQSAAIAISKEMHQQAFTYILKAESYTPPTLFLEKAKLHWMREEHEQALHTLKHGLLKFIPEGTVITRQTPVQILPDERKICAEAKLLIAVYNESMANVDKETNIQYYKESVDMFREYEKSLVHLGQYYDRIFQQFSDSEKDTKAVLQIHMINYFGKSLLYGTTYVYQSLPRLLSIWLDYGTRLLEVTSGKIKEERKDILLRMTKLIDTFVERLPSYIFLSAFSQMISRICHPQKEVYLELNLIITKLLLNYPQQTLWMMISVIKSSYSLRSKRCSEILSDSRLKIPVMIRLINDFTKLAEKLIELCNKEISDAITTVSINNLLRSLPRLIAAENFSEIMIPTHVSRKLVLPNPDFAESRHNPFPNRYVHIVGIEDVMTILPSLQRPRKIILKGSDGRKYIQMLKPKDDLRKDFRLMEFNDIVNQLLSRTAESRQRRLNIRLYSVVPLNEECGLIEWVPNLVGLRPILMNLYKQRGLGYKGRELREVSCKQHDSIDKKKAIFLKKLLPKYPPVLGVWFRKTFPDAQAWFAARTAYTRTTAVISMVGYILGLGDRHGENILLDANSGDTVHVDFNCLFNKGELFDWPEKVPFRLTQNMVSAMGPLGVEGVFRKSSACTLQVLRSNINTLMSIVTPFVYDPLVSWPRNAGSSTAISTSERTNDSALVNIKEIKHRLEGKVRTKARSYSIPLSVDGQVNSLISESMSVENLCQMYIGWGAYL